MGNNISDYSLKWADRYIFKGLIITLNDQSFN